GFVACLVKTHPEMGLADAHDDRLHVVHGPGVAQPVEPNCELSIEEMPVRIRPPGPQDAEGPPQGGPSSSSELAQLSVSDDTTVGGPLRCPVWIGAACGWPDVRRSPRQAFANTSIHGYVQSLPRRDHRRRE